MKKSIPVNKAYDKQVAQNSHLYCLNVGGHFLGLINAGIESRVEGSFFFDCGDGVAFVVVAWVDQGVVR